LATTVSWNGSSSTISSFVNSLFSPSVRNLNSVVSVVQSGSKFYSFTDGTTRGIILNAWLAAWQQHCGDSYISANYNQCPKVDRPIIGFIADYIKANSLNLYVPQLTYQGMQGGSQIATYSNSGYSAYPFLTNNKWNYGTIASDGDLVQSPQNAVCNFLLHMYYGSHFVIISNTTDLGGKAGPPQFWKSFCSGSLDRGGDKFNSHYSGANTTGYYYLNIYRDKEPSEGPLIAALLVALTNPATLSLFANVGTTDEYTASELEADGEARRAAANTFLQLEGWQNHFPYKGGWHAADYDSHKATLWNFSTFGACAFSEKRSTPIFLANSSFSTAINSTTKMPLYNGATAKESWMNPQLLTT
jgi:hypothetical protein